MLNYPFIHFLYSGYLKHFGLFSQSLYNVPNSLITYFGAKTCTSPILGPPSTKTIPKKMFCGTEGEKHTETSNDMVEVVAKRLSDTESRLKALECEKVSGG